MMDFNILCFGSAELAYMALQSVCQTCIAAVLICSANNVRVFRHNNSAVAPHTLIVEHHGLCPVFRWIGYGEVPVVAVFADDFSHTCPILSSEGLVHAELHHIEEGVQHRCVVCQPIIVVHSPHFCIVLVQNLNIIQAYQPRTPYRFPYLFVPMGFVVADFQGAIGEQAVQPFFLGYIEFNLARINALDSAL